MEEEGFAVGSRERAEEDGRYQGARSLNDKGNEEGGTHP
jgi:hypothetical protein